MEIQIALDRIPLDRAVDITHRVADRVDWIEVGTSLVKEFGQAGLREVVAAAGSTPVLADLKTVDDVAFEFALAFAAGARSVTVLGLAPEVTLDRAVEVAAAAERELVVDLMGVGPQQAARLADRLPDEVVLAPHVSKDAQGTGARVQDQLGPWSRGRRLALAGGLTAPDLVALRGVARLRVIVGSAVTRATDTHAAVDELRRAAGLEHDTTSTEEDHDD
jgi:3-hexulose-6-phosphate synthase